MRQYDRPVEIDAAGFRSYLEHRVSAGTAGNYLFLVGSGGPERVRERKLSPKYRRLIRASWLAYARFLAKQGATKPAAAITDELDEVKLPPPDRQRPQLPLPRAFYDELRAAIDESDRIHPAMRAQLGVMANRGIRRSDAIYIGRSDNARALKTGVLSFVAKGGRRMEFGVLPAYQKYLELFDQEFKRQKEDVVWQLIGENERAAKQAVGRRLRRVAAELDLAKYDLTLEDVRPHILRRSYATYYFDACGRDPIKLKDHMRWADIKTALSYVDATDKVALDAIAENMFK